MNKQLLTIFAILLLSSCGSSVPITFNGQNFNEYLNEGHNPSVAISSLHRKWKCVSFHGNPAPYNILLEDLTLWINLKQETDKNSYSYMGHGIANTFRGDYAFDHDGGITILSMGDDRVLRVISEDLSRIEREFKQLIRDAKGYEINGPEMRLYSEKDYIFLDFYAIN